MSCDRSLPVDECVTTKDEGDKPASMAQLEDNQTRLESSDDDLPIMARRQLRETVKERHDKNAMRERRSVRENERDSRNREGSDSPRPHQLSKPGHKNVSKGRKKSGPRAWAAKPIMKNDMVAKKAVIREIESYWGKGFIKSYVPKCHRPLVKRGKLGKRSVYREHETDPKKWLPSVLKAILMIAKLTDNKKWLKDAMNEVVRYRIKHTGNRKPQLVTTDFDVIEDMLVKQWTVAYAFEIRYKHLLVNRKDQQENDEDIDHILQAGSDQDDGSEDENDDEDIDEDIGDQEDDDEGEEEEEEDGMDQGQGGISDRYLQSSGYTTGSPYSPPTLPRQQAKQQKASKPVSTKAAHTKQALPLHQQHSIYYHGAQMPGYGLQMDPWGRSMPFPGRPDGYNSYGGYGGYGGYGPPQYAVKQEPHSSILPPPHGMYPPRHSMRPAPNTDDSEHRGRPGNNRSRHSPLRKNKRTYDGYEENLSLAMGHPDMQGHPDSCQGGPRPKIKRESPSLDERAANLEDFDNPTNDCCSQDEPKDDSAAIDAEVEAAELELKIARLRAKQAAIKKSK
ncbi:Nn.00g085990.m01.CDS01 [Neocucurbitaria sp. VM-36]